MPVTNYYTIDGQMIGYKDAAGRKDFLTDALGSITAEVDQTGATKTFDGRYKPYGGDLSSTGTKGSYGWIGAWGYRGTGLSGSSHYVRARQYSKTNGNWSTIDPIWPYEGSYVYGHDRPTLLIDPDGMYPSLGNYLPPRLFCPKAGSEFFYPCGGMPGGSGGCPNQSGGGMVDLKKFQNKGPGDSPNTCNPSSIDKIAINERLKFLQEGTANLCGPAKGGGKDIGLNYPRNIETYPCKKVVLELPKDPNDSSNRISVSCSMRCDSTFLRDLGKLFHGRPKNGIGCLACCELAHENLHCLQIIIGGERETSRELECAGWTHEKECLERVLAGKPCS